MSTDGFVLTTLIIFEGANHIAGWYQDVKEEEYWYSFGLKGYNNSQLCLEYLEMIFEPETVVRYVIILLTDLEYIFINS